MYKRIIFAIIGVLSLSSFADVNVMATRRYVDSRTTLKPVTNDGEVVGYSLGSNTNVTLISLEEAGKISNVSLNNATNGVSTIFVDTNSVSFYTADKADEKHREIANSFPTPGDGKLTIVLNKKDIATFSADSTTNATATIDESDPTFSVWLKTGGPIEIGRGADADGDRAIAIGVNDETMGNTETVADGAGTISIGPGAQAYGDNAISIGGTAYGKCSITIGGVSESYDYDGQGGSPFSTAINGYAAGPFSTAIGTFLGMYGTDIDENPAPHERKRYEEKKPLLAFGVHNSMENVVFDVYTNATEEGVLGGGYNAFYAYTKTLPEVVRDYSAGTAVNSQAGVGVGLTNGVITIDGESITPLTNGTVITTADITNFDPNGIMSSAGKLSEEIVLSRGTETVVLHVGGFSYSSVTHHVTTNETTGAVETNKEIKTTLYIFPSPGSGPLSDFTLATTADVSKRVPWSDFTNAVRDVVSEILEGSR